MVDRFEALAKSIFKKEFSEITSEEVQNLVQQYPYFAPAQLLQLQKAERHSDEYNKQYQKAILYYHDPITFNQFLTQPQSFVVEPGAPYEDVQIAEEVITAGAIINVEEPFIPAITLEETEIPATNIEDKLPLTETETTTTSPFIAEEGKPEIVLPQLETEKTVAETENKIESKKEETSPAFTFEPYHTVDYFASQGIKIPAEPAPQDQFGKQVKSFTDWLKTMKRLPLSERGKGVSAAAEKGVENLAEHSVQDADVVTESMAEVWIKQGNIEKAAEVYRKLSLQNPAKRTYFAAKIQQLT